MPAIVRQGTNTLNTRRVPIIFVPGVMGTRLHFPVADEDWDPDSTWAMLHWVRVSADDARNEMGFWQPATVIDTNKKLTAAQIRRGWAGVVTDFYIEYLRQLEGLTTLCAQTPVWVVGYDWRQGNRGSGAFLNTAITRILKEEKAEEFILISHSMGGIVCRSCLFANGGTAAKAQGVIHVVQPATGAVVFYRRMYTGAIKKLDGGWGLANIQGTTPEEFATLLSSLRGPCELIPNNDYRDLTLDWLWDDRLSKPAAWTSPMFRWYLDPGGPPGIVWPVAGKRAVAADMRSRMTESDAFHKWLGKYKHPKTWAIYSTRVETDVAARFNTPAKGDKQRGIQIQRRDQGDGTVPETSGSSLFTMAETSTDATGNVFVRDPSMRQLEVRGVDHADAFNSGTVRTVIEKMLLVALGCVVPAPPDTAEEIFTADNSTSEAPRDESSATDEDGGGEQADDQGPAPAPEDWSIA